MPPCSSAEKSVGFRQQHGAMKKHTLIALSILLAGCTDRGFQLVPPFPEQTGYDLNVQGRSLSCVLGETFTVALDVNADGGYRWDCTITQPEVVRLDSSSTRPKNPGVVGGLSVQTYSFHSVGAGSCRILLIQHRVWEPAVPPIQAIEYDIFVHP